VFVHTWAHCCICSSVRFPGTHLAHTRHICSISVTMCWVCSKEMFSEAESSCNVSLLSFSNSSATLAILTSLMAVDGLPECALSITRVLPSSQCLHHWNTAARLSVSPPYAYFLGQFAHFFPLFGRWKIAVRKICGFFVWRSWSGFYSSIIDNTVSFINILM
jgi:hypothetical protein